MGGTEYTPLASEDLRRFSEDFLKKDPSMGEHGVAIIVAMGICAEMLGTDWLRNNIDATRSRSADYLPRLTDRGDAARHSLWEYRLIELGRLLYEAQDLVGFPESVDELRRRTLRGVAAELRVAHLLRANGHQPRLVRPTGRKGRDYDIEVELAGQVVPMEVKSKDEGTALRSATIVSTLRDARRQIPTDGPGVVVLALPSSWVSGLLVRTEVADAVVSGLRNSHRINAVLLLWEAVISLDRGGRGVATCFRSIYNASPRTPVPGLSDLINAVASSEPVQKQSSLLLSHLAHGTG